MSTGEVPDRNLALELVRTTEAAAIGAYKEIGRNNKDAADDAAVGPMRQVFNTLSCNGVVVIGEGEKDGAPMLYNGEKIGNGDGSEVDIAVDPLEGTTLTSLGLDNALSVVAISERGTMFDPGPFVYMEKLAVGPGAEDAIDITEPLDDNIVRVAEALGIKVAELTVAILDRERNEDGIRRALDVGAHVLRLPHGDVSPAIVAARGDQSIQMLWGIGGSPEGVIVAAGLRCIGGGMQARMWTDKPSVKDEALAVGIDFERVLNTRDLVDGEDVFLAATGVTNGRLLRGVQRVGDKLETESLVARSHTGTFRIVRAEHNITKLRKLGVVI